MLVFLEVNWILNMTKSVVISVVFFEPLAVSGWCVCVCVSKSVSKIHDQQIMHVPPTCHDSLSNTECF